MPHLNGRQFLVAEITLIKDIMEMAEALMGPHDFLTRIMEFTNEEADEILANVLLLPKEIDATS